MHYQATGVREGVGSVHYRSTVVRQMLVACTLVRQSVGDVYYKSTLAGQDKALVACTTDQR